MSKKGSTKALGLFVVILTVSFVLVGWFTKDLLQREYEAQQRQLDIDDRQIDIDEWNIHKVNLSNYITIAKKQGQNAVAKVDYQLSLIYGDDLESKEKDLDNYLEPNNPIREIINQTVLDDLNFLGIIGNDTDGLVLRGNSVDADSSTNCASWGTLRSIDLEMLMHANPQLGYDSFKKATIGDIGSYSIGSLDNLLMIQFISHPDGIDMQRDFNNIPLEHQNKLGLELSSYDIDGLEKYYMKTRSWEKTFEAFEFIVSSPIFIHVDLADRPHITQGFRTDTTRMSLNVLFNYKTVVDKNPLMKETLVTFEERRAEIKARRLREYDAFLNKQSILLLVVILLAIICFIAMHYTNKLVEEEQT